MKKTELIFAFLMLALCLSTARGAEIVIPTTAATPFDITQGTFTGGAFKTVNGINTYDSFKNGTTATYTLDNQEAAPYKISFAACTKNAGNSLNFHITDADGNVELDQTIDITNNGSWTDFVPYNFITNTLTKGKKTFVLTFLHTGGGYTSNVESIVFTPYKADAKTFTLSTASNPADAGTISVSPSGSKFEEGSLITLSQTHAFGYKLINWTDAEGNILSTDDSYVFNITKDMTVTANYTTFATHQLDYSVTGGANKYMVQLSPAPTIVDGKSMYEEGTTVTLNGASNKILTFGNWSNGETATEIQLKMNRDQTITANYSARDYIVGWDFYKSGGSSRVADFASANNETAQLILRKADGTINGWLDKSSESNGAAYGEGCAVNWRDNQTGQFWWQTTINAAAFTDIHIFCQMSYQYNAYAKQNVEYSLNGTDWTTLGTITLGAAKSWIDGDFDLPATLNNKEQIIIRWKSDTENSEQTDPTSTKDGVMIRNIYITGTAQVIKDSIAPQLTGTVPAEASATASANGRIILTFDEKVKTADGAKATLGDTELTPEVSGKSVIFEYRGLKYATAYTFTLPANTIADLNGNYIAKPISISFTTKTRPIVAKGSFDFIVPDDGTFAQAVKAAAKRTDAGSRFRIFVKQGEYTLTGDEGMTIKGSDGNSYQKPVTSINTPNVSIIGEDISTTSLANQAVSAIEGLGNCATIQLGSSATGIYMQDITLKNGLPYLGGRGAALEDSGNKNIFKNVTLFGGQDTYLSNNSNGRFYFEGGTLQGYTDYLCGKGDVFYNGVDLIVRRDGSIISAPSQPAKYGYVFSGCTIKSEKPEYASYSLGRPWGTGTPRAIYINTTMETVASVDGWSEMSGGWPDLFAEYNSVTSTGTTIDLSNRKTTWNGGDGNKHTTAGAALTKEQAAEYTVANVMGSSDGWDPTEATEQLSAPENVTLQGTSLTWDDSQYALCWAVCKNGKVMAFTSTNKFAITDATATYSVRAANEMGGLSEAAQARIATGITDCGDTPKSVVKRECYNLQGICVNNAYRGVVIIVDTLSDGSTVAQKSSVR